MNKERFWELSFYFSLLVIMIWLILKIVGVIKTPVWIEYGIPITGAVYGVLAIYRNVIEKLTTLTIKVDHLDKDVEIIKVDANTLKLDVNTLKTKTTNIEKDVEFLKDLAS